ncbi:hypothetical protein [Pseudomonas sp. GV071]|uniref:hypothetical protein n=1 Tax=Pseudomonas sp. GV071 TaxID=2135754 RepID=UPI000D373DED|nr:hypothetical protein [Pseudomonas sp. GV071]PTQ69139.1 hypothetical protein C8K61_109158 [Pseudomonas sp. GV071]
MSDEKIPKKISLDDLKPAEPLVVELEGLRFEVTPVNVGLMMEMSSPAEQDTPNRDIGLRALKTALSVGGEVVSEERISSLAEDSLQQLAAALLEVSGFSWKEGHPLDVLGERLKSRNLLFSGLHLGEALSAQMAASYKGIRAAGKVIDALTAKMKPEAWDTIARVTELSKSFTDRTSKIEFEQPSLPKFDWSKTAEARSARAAETTAESMKEMLVAQGAMLKHIGDLANSVTRVALPQWLAQVRASEVEAKQSADRANRSLWWAVAAVFVSVVSTVVTAIFDASQSADSDINLNTRANAFEGLLYQQIQQNSELLEALQQERYEQFDQLSAIRAQAAATAETQEKIHTALSELAAAPVQLKLTEPVLQKKN